MKWLFGLSLVIFVAGCDDKELQTLQRVSDRALEKVGALAQDAQAKVSFPLAHPPLAEIKPPEPDLAERVSKRLQWDRYLSSLAIKVTAEKDAVVLQGDVATDEQRRRALLLAESTTGVPKVSDQMQIKASAGD